MGCFIFGKAASTQQFLGFMTRDSKVYSLRFELQGTSKYKEKGTSIKQVAIPSQVEMAKVFHCDGLVLCVPKGKSRLMVWNPYLGQRRWIPHRKRSYILDNIALGYDNNHNYKILRFSEDSYKIYDLSSYSWSVLHVSPDWIINTNRLCVSLKGSAYFVAEGTIPNVKNFFLGFDFTRQRFGRRLPLPFQYGSLDTVMLSCVREEQLSVLYQKKAPTIGDIILEIWVTNEIDPNTVSWSKFLKVDMTPLTRFMCYWAAGSFFIVEEKKVAVVFDEDLYGGKGPIQIPFATKQQYTYIIRENGYFKSVLVGESHSFSLPLVSSAYLLPSLVQINQPGKRKQGDA